MHSASRSVLFAATLVGTVTAARAGGVSVFVGQPGAVGSVQFLDAAGIQPPRYPHGLRGIRLLPLDLVGRTQIQDLFPDRPRLRRDIPGAGRIQLPGGHGSLYRFSRDMGTDGVAYGFLWIDPAGQARVPLERIVTPNGDPDPFVPRIAIAPGGDAVLVATTLAAGGDLLEVRLDAGVVVNRTPTVSPLDVGDASLSLSSGWGAALSTTGIWRFDRGTTSAATLVPIDTAGGSSIPTWFGNGLVQSANGEWAAAIAGSGYSQSRPYVFGAVGSARAASTNGFEMAGTGFLPEFLDGPFLAVSDDGSACAWRAQVNHAYSGEIYFGRLSASGPPLELHLTANERFEPYLDEVGLFLFRPDGRFLFAAAEAPAASGAGMIGMDLFRLSPPDASGSILVENLSGTSGELTPPFLNQPTLAPTRVHWIPSAQSFLLHQREAGGGENGWLYSLDPSNAGLVQLLEDAPSIDLLEAEGSDFVLSTREADQTEGKLWHLPPSLGSGQELPIPEESLLDRAAFGPFGMVGLVTVEGGGEILRLLHVGTGENWSLSLEPRAFGPALGFLQDGSLVASLGAPGTPSQFLVWKPGVAPRRISKGPVVGFVLPGL